MSGRASKQKVEWRLSPSFPDYLVSEYGDVMRVTPSKTRRVGHQPKGDECGQGYWRYKLVAPNGGKRVVKAHRLVCEAFHGPAPTVKHEVAHNDGDRLNNHFSNLRWATRKENHADIQKHGTHIKGERNGRAKLTENDVRFCRDARERGATICELAQIFDVNRVTMGLAIKGENWSHVR